MSESQYEIPIDIQANYDRDKELWAGKHQFLEQQKEQAKADLAEVNRKFELTLEQVQRKGNLEKEKGEANQAALLSSVEARYKAQIKEINDANSKHVNELSQRIKQLEKEQVYLNEKLQQEQKGKQTDQDSTDKKVADMIELQGKLNKELEDVKTEKEKKIGEYQKLFEKEREGYKVKLQELEGKYKESEAKKNMMMFDFEKERTIWHIEKDHLINQKEELQEMVEKLDKKKETYLKEIEKLKSERNIRKPLYAGGVSNSSAGLYAAGTTRYMGGTSQLAAKYKENMPGTAKGGPSSSGAGMSAASAHTSELEKSANIAQDSVEIGSTSSSKGGKKGGATKSQKSEDEAK